MSDRELQARAGQLFAEPVWMAAPPSTRRIPYAAFYESREWQALRYQALRLYGRTCMCCGADGPAHVDHIVPRSVNRALELRLDNLQILCRDCNLGKGNTDCIDYRTDEHKDRLRRFL